VWNGSRQLGEILNAVWRGRIVRDYLNLLADAHIARIGYVENGLIHRHPAGDWRVCLANLHNGLVGQAAEVAVGISYRHKAKARCPLETASEPIARSRSGRNFPHLHNS